MSKTEPAQTTTTLTFDSTAEPGAFSQSWGRRPTGKSYFNAWIEWQEILAAAEKNSAVQQALEQLITLHRLAKEHKHE